jgi:DNA modification methylase
MRKLKADSPRSPLKNTIGCGDSEILLPTLPPESVGLIFTSPPYFNAKPECAEYGDYQSYLDKMRRIVRLCHRVLAEGRFFVLNSSPVILPRRKRSEQSRRLAIPFDLHAIVVAEGFDFIDDIIWLKPEGAGWSSGRGRRFSIDRHPLQYKTVPVTEYIMVYRKRTDKLIDWHIRNHHDQDIVHRSRITGGYEKTNVWHIPPVSNRNHPAVFPLQLAENVIRYYSFEDDVVLDPYAGIGTVGIAALKWQRRFVLFEYQPKYVRLIDETMRRLMPESFDRIDHLTTNH